MVSKDKKTNLNLVAFITIITFIMLGGLVFLKMQTKPASETPKTIVKSIPREVKKNYASPSASLRVPILLYHYVEIVKDKRDTKRKSLNIPPNVFDLQLKTLSEAGYTFMTASELGEVLDGKRSLPSHPLLLTIDDGHWDLYTDILPILKKYNAKATAYIITGFIGGSDYLNDSQLNKVIRSGLVEIGAHTMHHVALKNRILPIVQFEVSQSKEYLAEHYHLNPVSFAYPDGSFDLQAIDIVKKSKFTTAVSTVPGIEQSQANRFFLFRIRPGYRTGDNLLKFLDQSKFKPW